MYLDVEYCFVFRFCSLILCCDLFCGVFVFCLCIVFLLSLVEFDFFRFYGWLLYRGEMKGCSGFFENS